jgi:hypothetical protein
MMVRALTPMLGLGIATFAAAAAAQCRGPDRAAAQTLSGIGVADSVTTTRPIALCTRHEYRLFGRAGQGLAIALTSPSGQKSMLTLVAPNGTKPVDGGEAWRGTLPVSGLYVIEVGTDVATSYTLRVSLR